MMPVELQGGRTDAANVGYGSDHTLVFHINIVVSDPPDKIPFLRDLAMATIVEGSLLEGDAFRTSVAG